LPIILLPVVFLGFALQYLWKKKGILPKIFCSIILIALFAGNIFGVYVWFSEMAAAQRGFAKSSRTIILKEQDGITLWHLEQAEKYIEQNCQGRPVYIYTNFEYYTPLQYVFALRGVDALPLEAYTADHPGCIFMFDPSSTGKATISQRDWKNFNVVQQKYFGVLGLDKLEFKENADLSLYTQEQKVKRNPTLFWRDVLRDQR
jgi:hypothetical protein